MAFAAAFLLLRFYVPGYLGEKGKNLATKEDIGKITEIVESVKHQNAELLEDRKAHNQLRFAALDQRLVAHQEAFTHWSKFHRLATEGHRMSAGEIDVIVLSAREWWYSNAIYLESDVRVRFDHAIVTVRRIPSMLKLRDQEGTAESTLWALETAQGVVRELCSAIIQAVQLPTLTGGEPRSYAFIDIEMPPMTGQVSG